MPEKNRKGLYVIEGNGRAENGKMFFVYSLRFSSGMLAKCPIPRIRKIYESFTDPRTKFHLSYRVPNNKHAQQSKQPVRLEPSVNPPPSEYTTPECVKLTNLHSSL